MATFLRTESQRSCFFTPTKIPAVTWLLPIIGPALCRGFDQGISWYLSPNRTSGKKKEKHTRGTAHHTPHTKSNGRAWCAKRRAVVTARGLASFFEASRPVARRYQSVGHASTKTPPTSHQVFYAKSSPIFPRQPSRLNVIRFAFPDHSRTEQVSYATCLSRGLRRAPVSDTRAPFGFPVVWRLT